MYQTGYGMIKAFAPLHIGAAAGEETGNLQLIFRDQFTQTGIIPGSSIRGRFRAEMRRQDREQENLVYGHHAVQGQPDGGTTEAYVKFEYASLVWLPVFCPGQPIVYVSCPQLLKRYGAIKKITSPLPEAYHASSKLKGRTTNADTKVLFFNLGWMEIQSTPKDKNDPKYFDWEPWLKETGIQESQVVVVDDADIAMIHDMALYRQSRVALEEDQKKVKGGAFFDVEALPEGSVLIFPVAIKDGLTSPWKPLADGENDIYLGGLESIGFGHCTVNFSGDYFSQQESSS